MAKSISDFYVIWQTARRLCEEYAGSLETEHLADEQFAVQQHAVMMMTRLPAYTIEEVRMKVRVALHESETASSGSSKLPDAQDLLGNVLSELEDYLVAKKSPVRSPV